ncbi:transporter [Sulfuriroseicoccus oceanibius]|uniref:Uncharacterized protein n=1 Tax=Sulfuriroseicoccus oceanibius TaxID=2707525 RepID=A0A6B3L3L5_9BACT|nr:transporter [Sulfuriroseicoccus oceanibius]QQL46088.1 hypothetical protein G3M56_005770 [Sulfuriroseicoccus oceanibius]
MISLPIDTSVDFGADNGTAVISNIQPVIPTQIGDWNLVSRFILPVAYVEGAIGSLPSIPEIPDIPTDEVFGLGDLNYTGFLSPAKSGAVIWGVGPSLMFPSATDPLLGAEKWSLGPSAVILTQPKPWSLGLLGRHLWSVGGASDRADVNQTLLQPFVNYNLDNGWYLMTDPVVLANWQAAPGQRWSVPVGGGIGRMFKIGNQPLNARLRGYYNVERPSGAPEWSVNFSLAFLFPK